MKNIVKILSITAAIFALTACCSNDSACAGNTQSCAAPQPSATAAKKQPRKIAVQMYTFRKYTLEESVPWLAKNGIYGLGITAGQDLTKKYPKLRFGPQMNEEQRQWFKDFIKANKCKVVSYGVVYTKTEADVEALCKFAKEMDVPLILTECKPELFPAWEKNCEKYGVKMAIHNHATDNKMNDYYNPKNVLNIIKPYKNIGACPDNGHWSRSGIDPIWGYKVLDGKIFATHFKDQAEFGNIKNQCVPYGTGELDMKGMLAELDRQGFDGYYIIEYEAKWDNNLPEVVKCADYLKKN